MMFDVAALPPDQAGTESRGRQRAASVHLGARKVRIRLVRLLLLGGSAAVIVVLGLSIAERLNAPVKTIEEAKVDQAGRLTINSPRFFGRAGSGEQIEISASSAIRDTADVTAPVSLESPQMTASDGTKAVAESGSWQAGTQTLVLRGAVDATLPDGGKARADEAVWQPSLGTDGKPTGGSELVLSGRVSMVRENGDTVEAQQASWDSSANLLRLYGATSLRQANGDSIAAPTATWNTKTGVLSMTGGAEYRRGNEVFARAGSLTWSRDRGEAALSGGVVVSMGEGEARSQSAAVSVTAGTIQGRGDVRLMTRLGTATAQEYEYNARTGRLILRGRAKITARR